MFQGETVLFWVIVMLISLHGPSPQKSLLFRKKRLRLIPLTNIYHPLISFSSCSDSIDQVTPVLTWSTRMIPDLGCPDILLLNMEGKSSFRTFSSAGIVTTFLACVRDRASYTESFWFLPSFSKKPQQSFKITKEGYIRINSGLYRKTTFLFLIKCRGRRRM